jgi:TRAP-type C4-dicarboxylate transport system permease small subunit
MLDKAAHWVERVVFPLNEVMHKVGLGVLLLMMFLTVGDVVGRYFFNMPISGTFELTDFMLALVVFFAIGYTQVRRGHISIDVVVSRFSPRVQAIIDSITYLSSLGLFSLVTWQSAVHAHRLFEGHNVSGVLALPIYPFVIAVAVGSLLFCLVMLVDLLSSLAKTVKHEP